MNGGRGTGWAARCWSIASCFQRATTFRDDRRQGDALNDLNQQLVAEVRQQLSEQKRASRPSGQESDVKQGHHARALLRRREIGRKRQTGGLRRMESGADQKEGEGGTHLTENVELVIRIGEQQQGERHHRESAELHHASEPDVRDAAQAECRVVVIGSMADKRTQTARRSAAAQA
jgi:hypothetical protein